MSAQPSAGSKPSNSQSQKMPFGHPGTPLELSILCVGGANGEPNAAARRVPSEWPGPELLIDLAKSIQQLSMHMASGHF